MDFLLIVCTVVLLLVVYAVRAYQRTFHVFRRQGIPEVACYPILGVMGPLLLRKAGAAEVHAVVYKQLDGHRIGGVFAFNKPVLVIRDPELIRAIVIKDFDHFTDHSQFRKSSDYDPIVGKSLVALQGQDWRNMRSTLSPVFTTAKMKAMFHFIAEIGQQMTVYVEKMRQKHEKEYSKGLLSMDMKELFCRFTSDVIASAVFGLSVNSLDNPDNEFRKMGSDLIRMLPSRSPIIIGFMLFPKLMQRLNFSFIDSKIKNFFHDLLHSSVKIREEQGIVRPDMIHLLMEASKGEHTKLSDNEMTAQALFFFLAGFETVATSLTFASYLIAAHEDVQLKLQQEIDSVVGKSQEITYEMLQKMKYLDMVFSETLRLYPPAVSADRCCVKRYAIPATATEPEVVFEKGQSLWLPIYGLHHDPKYFPDPERFNPDRFSDNNRTSITPYTYIPFGIGPRVCIGQRFAVLEAKAALAHLLRRFLLRVVPQTPVPLVLAKAPQMAPEESVFLGFESRTHVLD